MKICSKLTANLVSDDPSGHKVAVFVREAELTVDCLRGDVLALYFQMQRVDPQFAAGLLDMRQRAPPPAAAAVTLRQVQLVDKGVVAVVLDAVADRQDHIADRG